MATLTYSTGNGMITAALNTSAAGATGASVPASGVLLELANSLMVIVAGCLTYAVLKTYDQSILQGYQAVRIAEGLLLGIGALLPLIMSHIAPTNLIAVRSTLFNVSMVAFGAYSVYFCWFLLKQRLMYRVLTLVGMVGYVCLVLYSGMSALGFSAPLWLFLPGALFELAYPMVLIFKGYR